MHHALRTSRLVLSFGSSARSARHLNTAVRYHEQGPALNVLKLEKDDDDDSVSAVESSQVKLKMLAAPINPADLNMIEGGYGINPSFPAIGGNEGVGIITEVGARVNSVACGDYVIPRYAGFGTWRNFAVADENQVLKLPIQLPVDVAATLAVNPCTAYRLLNDFVDLKEGDVVIQNGANSAVGQAVVQLAAARGIKTINVMRHNEDYEELHERLSGLGGDIICTSEYVGTPEFKRLTSDIPFPKLGLNCTGGNDATNVARSLSKGATFVTYGSMAKKPVTIPTSSLIFNDLNCRGFWMSEWVKNHSVEERLQMLTELSELTLSGKLLTWTEEYKLSEFKDALQAVQNRSTRRKVILKMSD